MTLIWYISLLYKGPLETVGKFPKDIVMRAPSVFTLYQVEFCEMFPVSTKQALLPVH